MNSLTNYLVIIYFTILNIYLMNAVSIIYIYYSICMYNLDYLLFTYIVSIYIYIYIITVCVAQLDKASDTQAVGHGFEPHPVIN